MKTEPYSNTEMNVLIKDALGSNPGFIIPSNLTERTILRFERRLLFREIVLELAAKIGIVTGSLAILTGILYWTGQNQLIKQLIAFTKENKHLIVVLLASVVAVILIDQLVLKYVNRIKNSDMNTKLSRLG